MKHLKGFIQFLESREITTAYKPVEPTDLEQYNEGNNNDDCESADTDSVKKNTTEEEATSEKM